MTDLRKAAEAVLERWDSPAWEWIKQGPTAELMATLRAALVAPSPEPVAYFDLQKQVFYWARYTMIDVPMTVAMPPLPLYAAPPAAAPERGRDWNDGVLEGRLREREYWLAQRTAIDAAMQEDKT